MRRLRFEPLLLPLVATVILTLDQVAKGLVTTRLELGQSVDLMPWLAPLFHITYVTNTGAVFGLFQGMGGFFLFLSLVVVGALIFYHRHLPDGQVGLRLALGLQLGGALGNLTDRILRGSVVDFVDLNFWPFKNWAVFNIADASIVTGVTVLVLTMLWEEWQTTRQERETE